MQKATATQEYKRSPAESCTECLAHARDCLGNLVHSEGGRRWLVGQNASVHHARPQPAGMRESVHTCNDGDHCQRRTRPGGCPIPLLEVITCRETVPMEQHLGIGPGPKSKPAASRFRPRTIYSVSARQHRTRTARASCFDRQYGGAQAPGKPNDRPCGGERCTNPCPHENGLF